MSARLGLLAVALAATFAFAADEKRGAGEALKPSVKPDAARVMSHAGMGGTRCGACHGTASWSEVKFAHDKTGFPLKGEHGKADCRACHVSDFTAKLPRTCVGCHREPHRGELGQRCEKCHDEEHSWASSFTADAHRGTGFPLVGRHAVLPCEECHGNARDKTFGRPVNDCVACHQREYDAAALRSLDHRQFGFSQNCRECHGPMKWTPARFPQHDSCFRLSSGPHSAIGCKGCHTSIPSTAVTGTCSTNTAACTGCHTHRCTASGDQTENDRKHQGVLGYQCRDRKCYECHLRGEGL